MKGQPRPHEIWTAYESGNKGTGGGDGGYKALPRILRVGFGGYAVNLTVRKTLRSYIHSHLSSGMLSLLTCSLIPSFTGSQTGLRATQAPLSPLNKGQMVHLGSLARER